VRRRGDGHRECGTSSAPDPYFKRPEKRVGLGE
jgi:hypothetical protein